MKHQRRHKLGVYDLQKILLSRVDGKDWEDKYYPENIAKSIAISSNELLKEFQWDDYLSSWEKLDHSKTKKQITMNVINILYYLLMFVELAKIDVVGQAVLNGIPHFNISDPSGPDVI